jgi:hypothetical protein
MERETISILQDDGGVSPEGAVQTNSAGSGPDTVRIDEQQVRPPQPAVPASVPPGLSAEELAKLPPELRPNADGTYPAITPKLLKQLRGRYFTVKHVLLTNCWHKLDMINFPKRNCENCYFTWFNTHPQLVETADQFFRIHGKGPLIGMRGRKFFIAFVRYMATIIHFQKEEQDLANPRAATSAVLETPGTHTSEIKGSISTEPPDS